MYRSYRRRTWSEWAVRQSTRDCSRTIILRTPPLRNPDPSCLVVHRTKRRGGPGVLPGPQVTRFVLGYLRSNISPTCQTTIRNKRCSLAPLECAYITLLRACSSALHRMRTNDEMWMWCWPLKPHATFGVSTTPHHYSIALRQGSGELGSIGRQGKARSRAKKQAGKQASRFCS